MSIPSSLEWTATDKRTVDLIGILAMDAVEKAGSGHLGTAMGLAATQADNTEPGPLFVADAGASIGADHLGASTHRKTYQEFGITAERVAAAAHDSLARVRA